MISISVSQLSNFPCCKEVRSNRNVNLTPVTTCMSNHLGNEIFGQLGGKTANLSPLCRRILGLDSTNRRLEDVSYELYVDWPEDSFLRQIDQSIENEKVIMANANNIIAKEDEILTAIMSEPEMGSFTTNKSDRKSLMQEIQGVAETEENIMRQGERLKETFDRMMLTMTAILERLDIDPSMLDNHNSNDAKSKKAKKAKQAKHEAPEESEQGDLFTRNLIGVKEAVNDKFDMMERQMESQGKLVESKVDSIEGKVGSVQSQGNSIEGKVKLIESKVESIEGKVESIEKTMEELKDMLSQLMMRGADVA